MWLGVPLSSKIKARGNAKVKLLIMIVAITASGLKPILWLSQFGQHLRRALDNNCLALPKWQGLSATPEFLHRRLLWDAVCNSRLAGTLHSLSPRWISWKIINWSPHSHMESWQRLQKPESPSQPDAYWLDELLGNWWKGDHHCPHVSHLCWAEADAQHLLAILPGIVWSVVSTRPVCHYGTSIIHWAVVGYLVDTRMLSPWPKNPFGFYPTLKCGMARGMHWPSKYSMVDTSKGSLHNACSWASPMSWTSTKTAGVLGTGPRSRSSMLPCH